MASRNFGIRQRVSGGVYSRERSLVLAGLDSRIVSLAVPFTAAVGAAGSPA